MKIKIKRNKGMSEVDGHASAVRSVKRTAEELSAEDG